MWAVISTLVVCLFLYSLAAVLGARWLRGGAHAAPGALDLILVLLLCLSRIPLGRLLQTGFSQKAAWVALVLGIAFAVRLLPGRAIEGRALPQ
jgi:hypothetical protein